MPYIPIQTKIQQISEEAPGILRVEIKVSEKEAAGVLGAGVSI